MFFNQNHKPDWKVLRGNKYKNKNKTIESSEMKKKKKIKAKEGIMKKEVKRRIKE